MKLICIDNGFGDTKVKTSTMQYKFPSRIQPAMILDKDLITYNGIYYQVGAGDDDISADKSNSLVHFLCILRGIAENIVEGDEVHLILDLPLSHFYNNGYRKSLRESIMNCKSITYNGIPINFTIKRLDIYPQGLAAIYSRDITQYKNKLTGILDLGALTVDGAIIDNLKTIKSSMFSVNLGIKTLENEIKTFLNQQLLRNYQDYEIPYLLQDKQNQEQQVQRIISDAINGHIGVIKREMRAKNWNIDSINILGIGGGVIVLKEVLEENFKFCPCPDPVFGNVLGLWAIGNMR